MATRSWGGATSTTTIAAFEARIVATISTATTTAAGTIATTTKANVVEAVQS